MTKRERHVVTGGGGYAGLRLGKALLELGHEVILFDINKPEEIPEEAIFVQGDIRNVEDLRKAITGADCVYHLASYGMSGREQLNRKLIEEVNIGGTNNVLNLCKEENVERLVYTSTFNVVFGGQVIENGDESLPYLPLENGYIEAGLFALTYGSKDSLVEFLHVDNLVQAHIKAGAELKSSTGAKAAGQAYFISDNKPVNNFEFFRPLVEGLGYRFPTLTLPVSLVYFFAFLTEMVHGIIGPIYNFQPMLTRTEVYKTGVTHYFSNEKAKRELNYIPTVQNDLGPAVQWFVHRGHGKIQKKQNACIRLLVDLCLGVIFASVVLSLLPTAW